METSNKQLEYDIVQLKKELREKREELRESEKADVRSDDLNNGHRDHSLVDNFETDSVESAENS